MYYYKEHLQYFIYLFIYLFGVNSGHGGSEDAIISELWQNVVS